jgi:uncharacterized protein (DUF1501 family)
LLRRDFLKNNLALSAFATLPQLIFPQHSIAQERFKVKRRLVWISLNGGWDILESVDPKQNPNSNVDLMYPWALTNKLVGSESDIRLGRFFPGLASLGKEVLLLRGLAMGTTSHDAGSVYMDTGILSNSGRVNAASIPAIVASESQATVPLIQLGGGMEPRLDRGLLNPVSVVRAQNLELYQSMYPKEEKDIALRNKVLDYLKNSVERVEAQGFGNDRLTSVKAAETKIRAQIESRIAEKLSLTTADRAPFTEGKSTSESFAMALKLIKNDLVSCVNMGLGGFDTHSNQSRSLEGILPDFDSNLKTFVNELKSAGKLDDTLIVLYSDFGRTPKVNGNAGRDHWPVGGAVMIGGGILGGRAVGGTDENLLALDVDYSTGASLSSKIGTSQLNPTHLGGAVLKLCLDDSYLKYRSYLEAKDCLVRLRS